MSGVLGLALLAALLVWLVRGGRRPGPIAPEDDIDTPLDRDELAVAERELRQDTEAGPLDETLGGDDWGPGAPQPHSPEH